MPLCAPKCLRLPAYATCSMRTLRGPICFLPYDPTCLTSTCARPCRRHLHFSWAPWVHRVPPPDETAVWFPVAERTCAFRARFALEAHEERDCDFP